ncbi:MAG: hypothetical protein KBF66_09525 [Rhodoferax sp.]|uniref:hypothetical protein n=1 Tax=Rhodoferax sp. TaxID=50421 RepID=UPI001B46AB2F|nr:hypothetical protein [Rhodoferax sp.]MBP9905786.1 hypothetical protein [Rhodoferax sp.]
MTKAEFIFWTYFKGTESEKADWRVANQAFLHAALAAVQGGDGNDSEFRVAEPADLSVLLVIDDMPSQVLVQSDGEADVHWLEGASRRYVRRDLADPVSVTYNRFGKVKRKSWLNADGTITERSYNP